MDSKTEFELCLNRIISLAKHREMVFQELKDYENEDSHNQLDVLDDTFKTTIKKEAKFLTSL
ncbi:hypothetical protein [Sporomusa sp. KB1]|jgi:hypothetical protein|uniref:hypothetical protein n=1 Tax=Sporomusa sp. KB1 TaxID=943346 RepID=UPI0011A4EDCA|nr:hypothetical protein [Sporomusa sp. KB1]TWH49628.1 hypothetical protein Salpa_5867 [Sporomusa sp. KB1]